MEAGAFMAAYSARCVSKRPRNNTGDVIVNENNSVTIFVTKKLGLAHTHSRM